jgi:acyl carrier protein
VSQAGPPKVTRTEVAAGSTNPQGFLAVREDGARVSDLKDRRGMWFYLGIRPLSKAGAVPPRFNLSRRDQTMAASAEIRARVTKVLVQSLGVEEDEITPSANLLGDLGAESIDFLDIVFRLEREFGVQIPRGELFIEPLSPGDADYVQDGRVTEEGLVALRSQMPYADLTDLERDRRLSKISDLFTVDLLVRYITWKLEGGGEAAGSAHATALVSPGPIRR